ncbi:oligosaccharide flippase family protein [Nocardioides cavernae]|uniref:Oligosaccharide flippase family protein n=1 Tax=Nocardioides cavernae TaxID=1921566 RepID=A0ABR8N6K1_9ACTN|nr:oligosaccharide flippase family protein [Nocardioides cavernae]MBD3923152.1 oligosaccharide flippase family protein [Nocardioides cavernae]MBM7511927.1 O-antigen/teichoic acid export membrane protein [Nocardioides cavernae]
MTVQGAPPTAVGAEPHAGGPEQRTDAQALRRDIGRGVVWAAAGNILMRIGGISVTAVVARILSPEEFGVFAIALAVFVVVTSLAELGMASAVARSVLEPDDIAGTVTSISLIVSTGLAILMALSAGPLATVLGMPEAAGPIRVMSICLVLTGIFAVPGAQLVRNFRQDRILLGTVAGFVPANVVLIVMALAGQEAMAFSWSRVVGQVVTGLVFVACVNRRYRPQWRRELVGPLLRFGLPLSLANLINWTLLNADYLVMGRMLSAEQIGVYMIAFTVANWSTAVLGSVLNGVVLPAFGRVSHDTERLVESLVSATRLVGLVALPMLATTVALAPGLVRTVFGETWAGAAPVLAVLAVYGVAFAFTLLYVNLLVAIGATTKLLVVQVAWVSALVPAMVWGIQIGGLVGAAWAHVAVVLVVSLPGYLWALRSQLGPLPAALGTTLLRPAGAAALAGGSAWIVDRWIGGVVLGFLAGGVVAVVVYLVAAWSMIEQDLPEVGRLVRKVLPRRRWFAPLDASERPLRVGIVLEGLALGGCPINAIDLARTLRARGHHVVVIAVDEVVQVSVLPYAEAAGFDVVRIPVGGGLFRRARHLRREARRHDLDVLHVFAAWLGRSAVLACGPSRRRAVVVLNWLMDSEFTTTGRTSLVVGTGSLYADALDRHGPRSYLLEPPVDLARDRPDQEAARVFRRVHDLATDDILLVLVGRVDVLTAAQQDHGVAKLPGILLAMDALLERDDPSLRLVVVGDGSGMAQVRERAEQVNASLGRSAVVLTGALADPHPAYAAADIGLGMGGSALRMMAHAKPLVVLGAAGFSQLCSPATVDQFLGDGYYGTRAPGRPVAELLGHLDALADPVARCRLGDWGLDFVTERYGLEAGADRLETIYRDSLAHDDSWFERLGDMGHLAGRSLLGSLKRRLAQRLRARS